MHKVIATAAAVGLLAAAPAYAQNAPNPTTTPPAKIAPPAATPGIASGEAPMAAGEPGSYPAARNGTVGRVAQLSQKDKDFVKQAAQANHAEIQAGHLAMQKAQNPAVKEFGRWMVTDHTMADHLMTAALRGSEVSLPSQASSQQTQQVDHLRSLSGEHFDQEYIANQVQDHEQAVKLFQQASDNATNPQLRRLAGELLPALQQHLDEAQSLQATMSNAVASH